MCGISALFSLDQFDVAPYIHPMNDLIRHRGPDDEGYTLFLQNKRDKVILGGEDSPDSIYQSSLPYAPKESIKEWP